MQVALLLTFGTSTRTEENVENLEDQLSCMTDYLHHKGRSQIDVYVEAQLSGKSFLLRTTFVRQWPCRISYAFMSISYFNVNLAGKRHFAIVDDTGGGGDPRRVFQTKRRRA